MKKKITLFARLLVIPIIALCFSTALFAQGVNISFKNTPIKTVLREVTVQTGYNFAYSDALKELDKRIDIEYRSASVSIGNLLDRIFDGTGIIYSINDKQVALLNREIEKGSVQRAAQTVVPAAQSSGQITGIVRNSATDETLIGVVVNVKGTDINAVTNVNGEYAIMAQRNATLVFTYLGMLPYEVEVGARTNVPVFMEPDVVTMSEIVVTGYNTLSKERATGSYGTVSAVALETKLQPNLSSVLEGQVAGLTVNQNNKIEIRGVSTMNASKEPLIVVDGFPLDPSLSDSFFRYRDGTLENINIDNVENITVLKDGVAASIYGSRAANGVIVVTTKKGKKGDAQFSYKGTFSITQKPDLSNLHKASTDDYIDAEIDLYNLNPTASTFNINTSKYNLSRVSYLLKAADLGMITEAQAYAEIDELRKINYLDQVEKHLYRPQITHQHNFGITGGSETHTYNVAANYYDTRQNFAHTNNDRFTFDIRDHWKFGKFITFDTSINLAYSTFNTPSINPNPAYTSGIQSTGAQTLFYFHNQSYLTPYTAIADKDGNALPLWGLSTYKQSTYKDYDGMKNVDYYFLNDINTDRINTVDFQTRITGNLRFDITKGLNVDVGGSWQRGSYKYQKMRESDNFNVRVAYNDSKSLSNPANHYLPDGAILDETRSINQSWTFRTQANFNRNFDGTRHRITALAGMEMRRTVRDNATLATRAGYNEVAGSFIPMNVLDYNSSVANNDMLNGRQIGMAYGNFNYRDNRFVSWYANGSYEYDDRYLVTGSIRLDLTNFFGTDPKYRYKPLWSVGGTWKLSNESFFDVGWIDRLYLRASYGINGNISLNHGPFLILGVGNFNSDSQGISYSVSSPPNNQLRWEKTAGTNIGIDLSVLNNNLDISIDLYNRLSSDILASESIDVTTGFGSLMQNVGKIQNKGIEITLGANIINKQDFRWRIIHNFAYNKNIVKEYNVNRPYAGNYLTLGYGINEEGYPANSLWGVRWAPLNENGQSMVLNSEGERILSSQIQKEDVVHMGTTRPKYDLSLTNRFSYKNWELSFMFIAKLGHIYQKDAFQSRNYQNRHVGERWKKPGDEEWAIYPALTVSNSDWWYTAYQDIFFGNASFAKLRDLTLTYNMNPAFTKKFGVSNAKVYLQGRNLLTIKHKDTDIDPESFLPHLGNGTTGSIDYSMSTLPIPRELIIGLQIIF